MNTFILCIFFLLINGVKLDECDSKVTDIKNNNINVDEVCKSGFESCLVKCCGESEVIHVLKKINTCKSIEQVGRVIDLSSIQHLLSNYSDMKIATNVSMGFNDFRLLHGKNFVGNKCALEYKEKYVRLIGNGTATFEVFDGIRVQNVTAEAPSFCVDMVIGTRNKKPVHYYTYFLKLDDGRGDKEKRFYVAYGTLVSSFFMLMVLAVYSLLKQLNRPLQGKLLMTFIASLMLYNVINTWQTLHQYKLRDEGMDQTIVFDICKWISPIAYFLFLSTFTWLSTISFNIYSTFSTLQLKSIKRKSCLKKYLKYAIFAFGVPAAVATTAVLIDIYGGDSVSKPGFNMCRSDDINDPYKRMYMYIPISILVATNIVFFVMTVKKMWHVNQDIKEFSRQSSKNQKNRNQFILFIKLSVLMGINWIVELAQELHSGSTPPWLFYLLNTFNIFLGIIIFFLMVFKRSIFVMLCNRLGIENRWTRNNAAKSSTRTQTTKSRQTKATDESIYMESIKYHNSFKIQDVYLHK